MSVNRVFREYEQITDMQEETMNYQYPDIDDRLTMQLIEGEYESSYWEASEKNVLGKAFNVIKGMPKKDDIKKLLDLGCGKGRLIPGFIEVVDEITAVEPDESRFASAAEEGEKVGRKSGRHIEVLNGDISAVPDDRIFDVVLSSHVLQHITRNMAREMFRSISSRLEEGGLVILTTTHTSGDEDRFFCETAVDGIRNEREITGEEFDSLFGREGILPVRIFSEKSILSMAEDVQLEPAGTYCYHFKGHSSVSEDKTCCETGSTEAARDVMYIFRKKDTKIDADICYRFSFSIYDEDEGLRTDDEQALRDAICRNLKDTVFYDSEEAADEPVFRDLRTCEGFLHGGGLPFECFRTLVRDYQLSLDGYDVTNSSVLITVFPQTDTAQICVGISVCDVGIDDLVYFKQLQANGAGFRCEGREDISVREIFREVSSSLMRNVSDVEESYLVEINRYGMYEDVNRIIEENPEKVYGIMCGDEGWRHVPFALARTRMKNSWGSREFVRLISFGSTSVLFNLHNCPAAQAYRENRRIYDEKYYGDINSYFLMNSSFAGINHGVFFSIELVMVVKTICNRILNRQSSFYLQKSINVNRDIHRTKAFRGELLATLSRVEKIEITEIGEMEKVIMDSHNINPIIEKIKYLLDLVESELDLLYQNSTNRLINILTVAGLILSVIGIIAQVYSSTV